MPFKLYNQVLSFLQYQFPSRTFHSFASLPPSDSSIPLHNIALFYDYVIVDQQRFASSSRMQNSNDSFVLVRIGSKTHVGELQDIISCQPSSLALQHFGHMRWFRPTKNPLLEQIWAPLYMLFYAMNNT